MYAAFILGLLFAVTPSYAQSRRAVEVPLFKPTQILQMDGGNLNKNQALLAESATVAQQREVIVHTSTHFVDYRGMWRVLQLQFFRYAPQPNTWIMRAEVDGTEFTGLSLINKTQTGDNLDENEEMNRLFTGFYPVGDSQVTLFFNNQAQLAGIMDVNGDILHQGVALIEILYQDRGEGDELIEGAFSLRIGKLSSLGNTLSQFRGFAMPSFRQDGYPIRV